MYLPSHSTCTYTAAMREPASPESERKAPPAPAGGGAVIIAAGLRELRRLALVLAVSSLPLILDRSAVPTAAGMYALADGTHPYFIPALGWLLYVRVPLVTVSSLAVLLTPGLLLASALGSTESWSRWILSAVALSVVVVSAAAAAAQAIVGGPLVGDSFLLVVFGCSIMAAAIAFGRSRRGQRMVPPHAAESALESAAAVSLILVFLLPKFMWENFNGDGADALEIARLLLHHGLPFWPSGAGAVSAFPGITSMLFAYPASWFIRLFGSLEISARLPMLLALLGAHAGIVALAEANTSDEPTRHHELGHTERLLVWGALLVYTVVIAFSASYNPYSADIAIPGAQDTLLLAMFVGTIICFASGDIGWMVLFGGLTYISLPSGLILLGMLAAAGLVAWRPVPRRMLAALTTLIVVCVIVGIMAPRILLLSGLPLPGKEYSGERLMGRLAMIQFADWRRILYVVVPCGITPAIALFLWKRQDSLARTVSLLVVGYFTFTYLQAYALLHYYVPAMLLPIALYWRTAPDTGKGRREWRVAAVAGLCGAIVLSLPEYAGPFTAARHVSATIESRVPGYDLSAPNAFLASEALQAIFPMSWDRRVPGIIGGSPLVWNYYLHQKHSGFGEPNYVLQPITLEVPAGFHVLGSRNGFEVVVRDETLLAKQRALRIPVEPGSPLFHIPPDVLFRYATTTHGAPIHDVAGALARRGVFLKNLLRHF